MGLPRDASLPTIRRVDYRPPAFVVDAIDLDFALDPDATRVAATLAFRRNRHPQADRSAPLVLDGEAQRDVDVKLDGIALAAPRCTIGETSLVVHDAPDAGTLTIASTISPAANTALEGLYISSGVFCTQCEPEGFRRIAYFPDRPDVLSTYTVTIRADKSRYPVLLSNGNRVAAGDLDDGRHYATWHDPFPKPTYLFALVAGDLDALTDTFTTRSGREVALAIYSTRANLPRCAHAMASVKRAMRWDEDRFGLEYDLDTFMIFCADDFNMGAMENKGLNIFNSRLVLADPATATDDDFVAIEGVIGHEYFHNWTGNRVTCRDWFQLSLKEGLTVFRDQEFSSDTGSRAVERIAAVRLLRARQFAEDAGPMAHPVRPDEYSEINNFYTATVYEKGAEVVRMQHTLLGEERFRRGMDLYFARHDGQAVTCDDFVQAMEDASRAGGGPGLAQFRRWYAQAGTPVVRVRDDYDDTTRTYTLHVAQHTSPTPGQPRKEPLHIPLAVGLVAPDGADMPITLAGDASPAVSTRVLNITEREQSFVLDNVAARPVPSLARGFSAPIKVEYDYDDDALALLAAHDSDSVNRWDAAQRVYVRAIVAQSERIAHDASPQLAPALVRIASALVADIDTEPALIALALAPPDLDYVAECVEAIDAEALVAARRFVVRELARSIAPQLAALRARNRVDAPYAPTPSQVGRRMLANVALRLSGAVDDAAARSAIVAQYDGATNMTDTIAALGAINDSAGAERAQLFARFEAKWQHEPLVLDKWFMLQALSQRSDTLARVRALTAHPRFNARNPNRVRSLVGAFARNFAAFHAPGGEGYAFVAEQTVALDRVNPHVASMLAGSFNPWRRFAGPRRDAQRAALERIAAVPALSPDVAEVVDKALAD